MKARHARRYQALGVRCLVVAGLSLTLPSCGPIGDLVGPHVPQDCSTLATSSWEIGPFPTSPEEELRLTVGESHSLFLNPFVESQCVASIASVSWSTGNPAVASVIPEAEPYSGGWIAGLSPGRTVVNVRIVFIDGRVQVALSRSVVVGARIQPSGAIVAEDSVRMESRTGRYVSFRLSQEALEVDLVVDWVSPLNNVVFTLHRGMCSGTGPCDSLEFVPLQDVTGVTPLRRSIRNLAAGPYTMRIDNLGPGAETVHYEAWLTPR